MDGPGRRTRKPGFAVAKGTAIALAILRCAPSALGAEGEAPGSTSGAESPATTGAEMPLAAEGPHGAVPMGLQLKSDEIRLRLPRWFGEESPGSEEEAGLDLRVYWQDGINYRVANRFTLFDRPTRLDGRIGVRFQGDATAFAPDGIEGAGGGVQVRRLYFYTTGELDLLYPVLFALDLGVQSNGFFVDDAYIWVTRLPVVGTVKLGQFQAPMSLAQLTSSSTRPMMEIGTPAEAFGPGSNAGIQLANDALGQRLTWQVGWFADTQAVPVGDASQSVSRVIGRLTGLPVDESGETGPRFLHLGVSSSFVFSNRQRVRYRSRPESFFAPTVVDTGDIEASTATLIGLEAAWVDGPLSFQGEFLGSSVDASDQADPVFYGVYGMGSWFLTGETRPFNRASAVFGPVVPRRPLTWEHWQPGAWELAGRTSFTDLTSGAVSGGEIFTLMTGVNWYWNRYVRWMFEYGYANVAGGAERGHLHIFQARFQINI